MSKQDLDVFDDLLGAVPVAVSPAPNGQGRPSLQPPPPSAVRAASDKAQAFSDALGFDFLDPPAPPSGPTAATTRGLAPPPPPPSLLRKSVASAPPSLPLPSPAPVQGKLRLPSPADLAARADQLDAEFEEEELKSEIEIDGLTPASSLPPLSRQPPPPPARRPVSAGAPGALSASLSTMIEEELSSDVPGDPQIDDNLAGLDPLMGAEPLLSSQASQQPPPALAPPASVRSMRTMPSAQVEPLPPPRSVPRSSAPKSLEPPPPPPPFSQDQAFSLGALPPPPVVPDYDDRPMEGDFIGQERTNVYSSRPARSLQPPLPPLPQPSLPPISPPSVRIGPGTTPMSFPPRHSTAPVVSEARPYSMRAPGLGAKSRQLLLAALAVVGVLGVVLFLLLRPSSGNLVITVAAPGNVPAEDVRVFINGQQVCEASPCRIEDLKGTALVTAVAKGFSETAAQAVPIASGDDTIHRIVFSKDLEVKTTGLHLPMRDKAFKVALDGEFRGNLPLKLTELEPGEHTVRFSGESLAEPIERVVTVAKGELLTVEPPEGVATIKVKVVAGRGADGAHVEVDGKAVSLPATLELDPSKEHRLLAEREGYEPYERTLSQELAGETVRVSLLKADDEEATEAPSRGRSRAASARSARSSGASAGGTRLSFRSDPPANVVLNGRPLGRTPRASVPVKAGANTVVFVHPQKGRKVLNVNVPAGTSKTVSVRF